MKLTCQERLNVIAAMLGALVTLAAEPQTQAQNMHRVSSVLPGISGPTLFKLATSEDLDHVASSSIAENGTSAPNAINLICALGLTGWGAYFFFYLLRYAAHPTYGMIAGAGMATFGGLYWLWADFINADPRPEK